MKTKNKSLFSSCLLIACLFGSTAWSTPMVRVQLYKNSSFIDETVLYYQSGATPGFDSQFDAYKLFGPNPAPVLCQQVNSTLLSINGIEQPQSTNFSVDLLVKTPVSGYYTISATDFSELPSGSVVILTDRHTGLTQSLMNNSYSFYLEDTTVHSRFILTVSPPLATETPAAQEEAVRKTGKKTVQLSSRANIVDIKVLNAQGEKLHLKIESFPRLALAFEKLLVIDTQTFSAQLDLSSLERGLYVLTCIMPNGEKFQSKIAVH